MYIIFDYLKEMFVRLDWWIELVFPCVVLFMLAKIFSSISELIGYVYEARYKINNLNRNMYDEIEALKKSVTMMAIAINDLQNNITALTDALEKKVSLEAEKKDE